MNISLKIYDQHIFGQVKMIKNISILIVKDLSLRRRWLITDN